MSEQYAPLFDRHGAEVGTLVSFPGGTRRLATDPQPYLTKTGRGYKLPARIWPLFDAEGEQVRLLEPVPGSENRTEAA
jgi:hypothetical protein